MEELVETQERPVRAFVASMILTALRDWTEESREWLASESCKGYCEAIHFPYECIAEVLSSPQKAQAMRRRLRKNTRHVVDR